MNVFMHGKWCALFILTMILAMPVAATADDTYDDLRGQIETLEDQLQQLRQALESVKEEAASKADIGELRKQVAKEVTTLKTDVADAAEWKTPNTLIHMAGYADVGYVDQKNSDGSFNIGTFAPIFHYQYKDLVLLESELEFGVEEDGSTEVALEYLTIDYFLNDYVTIQAGKFLSPIGQFRQNVHPSWINKLASAPPGFGHDGAAPVSDVGFQVRGGFPVGDMFANYALFASNGPELIATEEDEGFELEGIEAEGFGSDADGDKVFGGRFGFLPLPGLEIGVSAATGKASVTSIAAGHAEGEEEEDEHVDAKFVGRISSVAGDEAAEGAGLGAEPGRDYDVFGFDFLWSLSDLQLRGEYVRSEIGADNVGLTASEGVTWETWYSQAAYRIPSTKWETVIRYSDFDSPHSSGDQQQWAAGLNYLFTPSFIGKFTYEFNDAQQGSSADSNRWLVQLAYGF
jgi:hypothetical protein